MPEPRRSGPRPALLAATALAALVLAPAARAEGSVSFLASPLVPGQAQYEAASRTLAHSFAMLLPLFSKMVN